MRRARSRSYALASLFIATACSSTPPPAAPAASAPTGSESGEAATADAPLDLAPAPAPKDLVGRGTWRNPAKMLDTLASWMQPGLDWRALIAGPLEELITVIDFAQPLDVVVALDPAEPDKPRAHFAVAVGLTSRQAALDAFRARGGPVDFVEPGVYSVQLNVKTPCFVAASLGSAPARLVCSENREALDALSPYLTRGEPSKTASPADLSIDVLAEPLWQRFGQQAEMLKSWLPLVVGELPLNNDALAATVSVAARAVADEAVLFLGDLSRIHLEAQLRTDSQSLELNLGSDYRSARSWIAESAALGATRASTAPDAYWLLPADVTLASHTAPNDPTRTQGMMRVVGELLEGGLRHLGASNAERDAWLKAFTKLNDVQGPWVSANGRVPPELMQKPIDAKELARARLGYKLFGVKDDADLITPLLERTLKLYEDAALRKGLSQRYGVETASLPRVQQRRSTQASQSLRTYELTLPAAMLDDGKSKSAGSPAPTGTVNLLLTSVRKAPWTWIGVSSYDKLLDEKLRGIYDEQSRKATLATRPGLEVLKTERVSGGGFLTLAEIVASYPFDENESPAGLLAALPNAGQTPMIFLGRTAPEGPQASANLSVPKAVFQDLGAALFR